MAASTLCTLFGCSLLLLLVLLPQLVLLAEQSSDAPEKPAIQKKANLTRIKEMMIEEHVEFNRTRKDDDKRPSYALIHVWMTCQTNYTEVKKFLVTMAQKEYWPNVYFKLGQDARPTLYIFTAAKKYAHRFDIENHTESEIRELLNSYGFYGIPDPEEKEEVEAKTEL